MRLLRTKLLLVCASALPILLSAATTSCSDAGEPDGAAATPVNVNLGKRGLVYLRSTAYARGTNDSMGASFSDVGLLERDGYGMTYDSCARTEIGDGCVLSKCTVLTDASNATAGVITVAGEHSTVDFHPRDSKQYGRYSYDVWPYQSGERVVFRAQGTEIVPAFEAALTTPAPMVITKPEFQSDPTGNGKLDVARGKPFELAWSSPQEGRVNVEIFYPSPGYHAHDSIQCSFPASDGKGTISAQTMARITDDAPSIRVHAVADTSVKAGEYDVRLVAVTEAINRDKSPFPLFIQWR